MRPRGEIRKALSAAASELHQQSPWGFTCRQLAVASQVGYGAARYTVKDMLGAGELKAVGLTRVAGVCRPCNLYAPATPDLAAAQAAALTDVMSTWAARSPAASLPDDEDAHG